MKLSIKSAVAGVSTLAVAGSMVIGFGGVALAATPPYDPSLNGATQGTLSLYNAAGQQIVSGSLSTPPAYVQASTDTGRAGDTKASIYAATPVKGANALTWPNDLIAAAKTYPDPSAPANLQGTLALGSGIFSWLDPANPGSYASAFPNTNSDPLWQNLYQLRILTSGAGQAVDASRYASLSIQINAAAGTWTQVYPDVVATATATSLNDPGQQTRNVAFNLTGKVAPPNAAGTVELFDGANSLGTTPVTGTGTNTFSKSVTLTTLGSHTLKAVFTPTPPSGGLVGFASSTSTNVTVNVVKPSATVTQTALAVNPTSGEEKKPVTLTATVTPNAGVGNVQFLDNGALIPGSQTAVGAGGVAAFTSSDFAFGSHSFTAQFVPTDATDFLGSTSAAVDANYTKRSCPDGTQSCIDEQTFKVKVPAGSLSITTPYTQANPFDLGTMDLNQAGTQFHAGAQFPKSGDTPLTITDTRAGDLPWTAFVTANDFTNGGSGVIDSTGLSYTNVTPSYIAGNALNAATKPVVPSDVASVKGGPHQFASAVKGIGTVYIDGRFDLTAPSSTPAGLYTATVTFTVS